MHFISSETFCRNTCGFSSSLAPVPPTPSVGARAQLGLSPHLQARDCSVRRATHCKQHFNLPPGLGSDKYFNVNGVFSKEQSGSMLTPCPTPCPWVSNPHCLGTSQAHPAPTPAFPSFYYTETIHPRALSRLIHYSFH